MTVRAQQIALGRFFDEPSETSTELPEAELLRRWISVMKLERLGARGVATVDAPSPVCGDEIELSFAAPLPQRSAKLLATPIPPCSRGLLSGSETEWGLRSVVPAERRAFEAEASAIERLRLSVDGHLCRELAPAGDARERPRSMGDWLTRSFERLVGTAVKAVLSTPEIAPSAVDSDFNWKTGPRKSCTRACSG